jgi:hypothetical protein
MLRTHDPVLSLSKDALHVMSPRFDQLTARSARAAVF